MLPFRLPLPQPHRRFKATFRTDQPGFAHEVGNRLTSVEIAPESIDLDSAAWRLAGGASYERSTLSRRDVRDVTAHGCALNRKYTAVKRSTMPMLASSLAHT